MKIIEDGDFFFIGYIADKTVITKIKLFNFVERDIIDYNVGDGKIIGVIENVSLTHYINETA